MAGRDPTERTDREEARARLKASVDALAERANLQVQMQKEPLKMLGGASAVGTLIGVVLGRQLRRTKKIYVDADSPVRYQKDFIKAQQKQGGGRSVGGALVATLGTLAVRTLTERVIKPRLEEMASQMLERSGQSGAGGAKGTPRATAPLRPQRQETRRETERAPDKKTVHLGGSSAPVSAGASSFLKREGTQTSSDGSLREVYGEQTLPSGISEPPKPKSTVEAKAQGSAIAPQEKVNPNIS